MTVHSNIIHPIDVGTDALELEGLALAMRIVVADYLSDRQAEKCNALDALACALHDKAKSVSEAVSGLEELAHV